MKAIVYTSQTGHTQRYAQLLADKKKAYGEYRQARATMRELLTVKNNVDRVLAMEQTEPQQKEKDHGQR